MSQSRSDQTASSRFFGFLTLLLIVALGFNSYFIYRIKSRVDSVEGAVAASEPLQTAKSAPALPSDTTHDTEEVRRRLTFLESQQGTIATISKSALDQMDSIFKIVAAFFGLFAAFSAYRQLLSDKGQETRDQEMLGLVGEFRQNITVINGLIGTLKQTYEFRGEVQDRMKRLDEQIVQIDRFKQRTEQVHQGKLNDINAEALKLFSLPLDRQSFKLEDVKGKLQSFYVSMNAIERVSETSNLFSPFAYFCRALHFFNQMQYEPAGKDLEEARRLGSRELIKPLMSWYGESTEAQATEQLQRMLGDCSYHLGIIYYNLGKLEEARKAFHNACSLDRYDFRSRIYIPELMFFDTNVPFAQVRSEYEAVYRELDSLSLQDRRELKIDYEEAITNLKLREGNIYLPKKIPLSWRAGYRGEEKADQAVKCYREAFEHSGRCQQRQTLTQVFASWSLAQALELVGTSQWGQQQPANLFLDVFREVSKQIVFKTEPVVLVQLNYILAVSADKAVHVSENPRTYLSRAREQLQRVPDQIRVFSPMNKVLMTRKQLLEEMDLFEFAIADKGAYAAD